MNILENFKDLFLEIWQQGIAGVNFTQIGLAIAIFLFFLLLRGLIAKFILQRLKNYVAKTSNKFDDALEELRSIIMAEKLNTRHQTNNYQKLIDQLTK